MRETLADSQSICFIAVCKQPIVPDFHKSGRQDVQEETPDEFKGRYSQGLPLVVVPVVPPLKRNLAIDDVEDAVVRNGDAMGVTPEVLDNGCGGLERRLAINDPFFVIA